MTLRSINELGHPFVSSHCFEVTTLQTCCPNGASTIWGISFFIGFWSSASKSQNSWVAPWIFKAFWILYSVDFFWRGKSRFVSAHRTAGTFWIRHPNLLASTMRLARSSTTGPPVVLFCYGWHCFVDAIATKKTCFGAKSFLLLGEKQTYPLAISQCYWTWPFNAI